MSSTAKRMAATVLACSLWASTPIWAAENAKLSLEAVLAQADAPHPDMDLAQAQADLAHSEVRLADSLDDFRVTLEGALRSGKNDLYNSKFHPDHQARLLARKNLYDGGLTTHSLTASGAEADARALQVMDARTQRRLTLMARFFDVLLAEMQYNADSEFMAVAYVDWDNNKDRQALGQIPQWKLAELESRYLDVRARRNDTLRTLREKRMQLAQAMNRPEPVQEELLDPRLADNDRPLPEYETLLQLAMSNNPGLRSQDKLLAAAHARRDGARAAYRPSLEFEAEAAAWSRSASTRDDVRAGLNFILPLWQGDRQDASLAREQARITQVQAQRDKDVLVLRGALQSVWEEIHHLRDGERRSAQANAQFREMDLEKARAEYEMEMKTNLGTGMAETQTAQIRRRAVEYRLALALARLEALLGVPIPNVQQKGAP